MFVFISQIFQDKMKSLDKTAGSETIGMNNQERENQSETSHNQSLLLADPWKPCQRSRATVKGQTGVENHSNVINTELIKTAERSFKFDSIRFFYLHMRGH